MAPLGKLWPRRFGRSLLVLLATRAPVVLIAMLVRVTQPVWPVAHASLWLEGWIRGDALGCVEVALHGYQGERVAATLQDDTAQWPMFPLLLRAAMKVVARDPLWIAFFLNHLLLLGAVVLFDDLAARYLSERGRRLAVLLLLLSPFSLGFSGLGSQSCLLFLVVLVAFLAVRERWLLAGLAAACAGATRPIGMAALAALLVFAWASPRGGRGRAFVATGLLGPLGYLAYSFARFGDASAFTARLKGPTWGPDALLARAVESVGAAVNPDRWPLNRWQALDVLVLVMIAIAIAFTVYGRRRLPLALTVFSVVALLFSLRHWTSAGRDCAILFPMPLALAGWLAPRPRWTAFVGTLYVLLLATLVYFQGIHRCIP